MGWHPITTATSTNPSEGIDVITIEELSTYALRDYIQRCEAPENQAYVRSLPCGDQDALHDRVKAARAELQRRDEASNYGHDPHCPLSPCICD